MKYRLSPFHFIAILALGQAIYEAIIIAKEKGEPGLGGLYPYVLVGFAIGILLVDLVIQLLFQKNTKLFYLIESILCLVMIIGYMKIEYGL